MSEKRLVEGVLEAGWEGVPKVNPPLLGVEKENPVEGVVVVVLAVPNVNPPVEAPVLPKLNPLMVPDCGGNSYSNSQSKSASVYNLRSRSRLLSSTEAAAASLFHSHGVLHLRLRVRLHPAEQPLEPPPCRRCCFHCYSCSAPVPQPCHSWRPWGSSWTGACSQLAGWAGL